MEVHSHEHLQEIFTLLWSPEFSLHKIMPRGGFADLVFRMVIFHQSMSGLKVHPPMVELSETEKFYYSDPLLLKYMLIMMIADSSSYTFLYLKEADAANNREFRENNKAMRDRWGAEFER